MCEVRLVRDEHSSLLQKFITYDRKKFYNIGPWSSLSDSDREEGCSHGCHDSTHQRLVGIIFFSSLLMLF
jgi:hypothetical protein